MLGVQDEADVAANQHCFVWEAAVECSRTPLWCNSQPHPATSVGGTNLRVHPYHDTMVKGVEAFVGRFIWLVVLALQVANMAGNNA